MTKEKHIEFLQGQIKWFKEELEKSYKNLETTNRIIKMQRKRDREFVEGIWSKGVVNKFEIEHYNPKTYKSSDMEDYLSFRRHDYKFIKWCKSHIQKYERELAEI